MSITAEERERVFEQVQQSGNGITFLFSTFGDIAINEEANSEASYFIRRKIAQIVKDPVQARKLTPPGGFNRRPVTANGYYETFNWDNVDVVDVLDTPMEITPTGIKLSDGTKYDLDAIVFATALKPLTACITMSQLLDEKCCRCMTIGQMALRCRFPEHVPN